MRPFRCRCLLPAAALLLLPLLARSGQDPREDDPEDALPKDIGRFLDARRGLIKPPPLDLNAQSKLLQSLMKNFDPKSIDPETIKKFLKDNPQLLDPENLKQLRDRVKQQMSLRPDPANPNPVDWKNLEGTLKKLEEFRKQYPKLPIDPKSLDPNAKLPDDPTQQSRPPRPPPPNPNQKQTEDIARRLSKTFGESPAMQSMAKDFLKMMGEGDKAGGMSNVFNELGKEWKALTGAKNDSVSGNNLADLASGLKIPVLPSVGGGGHSGPTPSVDTSTIGSSGSVDGGSWTGLLALLLLAVVGFFYWYKYLRGKPASEKKAADELPMWPINPQQVASRADVVKAFDFLSVTRCGQEAANWHHRQVADALGGKEPDKREAVVHLAGLYEKARYAPARDPFGETEIAEARIRLCQIAGVPSA